MMEELPVHWHEGMFLAPHHFQQADRHRQRNVERQFKALHPFGRGISAVNIDAESLASGQLVITAAEGVFPDGHYFRIPDITPAPPAILLQDRFPTGMSVLPVSLGMRRHQTDRPIGPPPGATARDIDARYSIESIRVNDENTGTNEREILVRRDQVRALLPDDSQTDHWTLRVAEIMRRAEGGFQLRPDFVPPCITLGASAHLMEVIRRTHGRCTAHAETLAGRRRPTGRGAIDFTVEEAGNFILQQTLHTYIPLLAHLIKHQQLHPEFAYRLMAQLAGALTAFGDASPQELPSYDHDDQGAVFDELERRIPELLVFSRVRWQRIPLTLRDEIFYHAQDLDDHLLAPPWALYLGVKADVDDAVLIDTFPRQCKIAADSRIGEVVQHALGDVRKDPVPNPPKTLHVKSMRHIYFRLEPRGEEWDFIRRTRSIGIYVPRSQRETTALRSPFGKAVARGPISKDGPDYGFPELDLDLVALQQE